jgi:hypothetical protein
MICFLQRKNISKQTLFFSIPPFLYDDEDLLFGSFWIDRFGIETNSLMADGNTGKARHHTFVP